MSFTISASAGDPRWVERQKTRLATIVYRVLGRPVGRRAVNYRPDKWLYLLRIRLHKQDRT